MTIPLEGEWRRVIPKVHVYSHGSNSIECQGGTVINTKVTRSRRDPFTEDIDLPSLIRGSTLRSLDVMRESALGDVIVALACLRVIKRKFPHLKVNLWTRDTWHELLKLQDDVGIGNGRTRLRDGERGEERLILDFNAFYELDHQGDGIKISRVDRTLGCFDLEKEPVDFSLPIPEKALEAARAVMPEKDGPWIAVSARRTTVGACRSPDEGLVSIICTKLREAGYGIYIVEGHESIPWAKAIGAKWRPKSSIVDATAAIKLSSVLLTPDSGSMWLAHVTNTPIVGWMGPTPGDVKCKHHPRWPKAIRIVQTNDWIDCPSCFENEEACEWTTKCLSQVDAKRFVDETIRYVKELVPCPKTSR